MSQIGYYAQDINEAIRVSSDPARWRSYLPENTPFTTDVIPADTSTKVKVPTTVITNKDFAVVDIGGGDLRVQFQGLVAATFNLVVSTGMRASANGILAKTRVYQNDTPIPGAYVPRTISAGSDTGAFPITGVATLQPLDTISFWVEGSSNSSFTFDGTSIAVVEVGYSLTAV